MYFPVHTFYVLVKQLLSEDGVDYVSSDELNQNTLEKHFGKQRARGGLNKNTSLKEYVDNERKLLVAQLSGFNSLSLSKNKNYRLKKSGVFPL